MGQALPELARLRGMPVVVTGLTGQDGYILTELLLRHGARVAAAVRRRDCAETQAIADQLSSSLNGTAELLLLPGDLTEPRQLSVAIAASRPKIVYHLGGESSVKRSWQNADYAQRANTLGTLHLMEAIRRHAPQAAFVLAGSCDCYDHEACRETGVRSDSPLMAANPYAVSKIAAQELVQCYRREHGMHASVAVMFNHTSPRRPEMYIERRVVLNAVRVALGLRDSVAIGSPDSVRDWSWAEDVMEGFALAGLQSDPGDVVLASGRTRRVQDWVDEVFRQLGLDPQRHLRIDPTQLHRGDRAHSHGNIEAARERLGWQPRTDLPEMVRRLIAADRAKLESESAAS